MSDAQTSRRSENTLGGLPMMIEMTFIISRLIVAAASIFVVIISIMVGVDYLTAIFRGLVAVLVLGFIYVGLSWYVTRNSIAALKKRMQQVSEQSQAIDF